MKIYHAADIHLGRRRLDGRLPDDDLAAAFRFVAEEAVRDRADVFLLAGDLFDRPQVEPPHLRQAQSVLRLLKSAGIPVVAIEGNHDRQFVNTEVASWVRFLAEDDLLILLRPRFHAEGVEIAGWNPEQRSGAWIDIGGVRFTGAGYLGAATPHKTRQIVSQLDGGLTHVLLLHAGPEYFVGEGGGFGKEDLALIKDKVCYLALGHIHKPMIHGDWACNTGSPENCELHEAGADRDKTGAIVPRGYAVVELDPTQRAKPVSLTVRTNPRRPVHRIELDCTPFGTKTRNGAEALVTAALKAIAEVNPKPEAVIDLWLTGRLLLNRIAIDQNTLATEITTAAQVFAVAVDTTRLNVGAEGMGPGANGPAEIPRDELERKAIRDLVETHPLWGLEDQREEFARLFYELKEAVRTERSAEEIAGQIAINPLVRLIGADKSEPVPAPAAPAAETRLPESQL